MLVSTAMPLTVPLDRTLARRSAHAFGRLRALLRQQPLPIADAIAQARDCGRCAAAAEMRLDLMVDVLVNVLPVDLHGPRSLPESLIDAAVEAYLLAAEHEQRATHDVRAASTSAA